MNFFIVLKMLGLLLATAGAAMLPALGWSLYYGDGAHWAILGASALTLGAGGTLYGVGRLRPEEELFRREATAVVGLGWLLVALAGALPFYFAGAFDTFIDCWFESMSGFTTTGASVLTADRFDAVPEGIHFWRCFTHWLGGMGIIVLFVALLPFLGASGRALMRGEVPGPVNETLTPRVKDTAAVLWKLYLGLTALETALLMFGGLSLFDALCHTFATLATGGFSTHPDSIAGYDSLYIDVVIVLFMIAAGSNFALYYRTLRGERSSLLRDPEWRTYVGLIAAASVFTALALHLTGVMESLAEAFRYGGFQVVSLMTTTGFATHNFDGWPVSVKVLLLVLMFVGGCAGSTGGGIKVMRWVILAKTAWGELERVYSPRTVRKIRLGKMVLPNELRTATLAFFLLWVLVFVFGVFAVALLEADPPGPSLSHGINLITVATAVVATLNNIGPGLGAVGAVENYAHFAPATKVLLTFFMVLGRLELFSILVLFAPRFWRGR